MKLFHLSLLFYYKSLFGGRGLFLLKKWSGFCLFFQIRSNLSNGNTVFSNRVFPYLHWYPEVLLLQACVTLDLSVFLRVYVSHYICFSRSPCVFVYSYLHISPVPSDCPKFCVPRSVHPRGVYSHIFVSLSPFGPVSIWPRFEFP